ncbi:hypothetical protein NL676_030344 [Syzygium grande]|nr:hypothetical protein NL676_030344 [Syzygium grande]
MEKRRVCRGREEGEERRASCKRGPAFKSNKTRQEEAPGHRLFRRHTEQWEQPPPPSPFNGDVHRGREREMTEWDEASPFVSSAVKKIFIL